MGKLQFKGTQGNFVPEPEPTPNPAVDAYQVAILQQESKDKDAIIPGFAFGRTAEICMANAHLFANAKLVLQALDRLVTLHNSPDKPSVSEWGEAVEEAQYAMELSYGLYKTIKVEDVETEVDPKSGLHIIKTN